jgi:hypothetical protein
MNAELKKSKAIIRDFMRAHYTDERLAQLYAHAKDGRLLYASCCCFVGIINAPHALSSETRWDVYQRSVSEYHAQALHVDEVKAQIPAARVAESAYLLLADHVDASDDATRCRLLVPMIRAEMRRRERLSANLPTASSSAEVHQGDIITSMEGLVDDLLKLGKTL